MSFPDFAAWPGMVLHPSDRTGGAGPYHFETPAWHANYLTKHRIAAAIHPSTIIEVGVRFGYSAHAFLSACPGARYIGVDVDSAEFNAMGAPTCDWAFAMLRRTIPGFPHLELIRVDTQQVDIAPLVPEAEFIHIDAAHSYAGATRDLEALWPKCLRAMLVDDYFGTGSVHDAVKAFVGRHGATLLTAPSQNGEALIFR